MMKFKQYVHNWLYIVKVGELKRTSFDTLENTVNRKIMPVFGDKNIEEIEEHDIRGFINSLLFEGYSHSVIKKNYDALNACLKYAYYKGDILKNPMDFINPPSKKRNPPKEIKIFDDLEMKLIQQEASRKYMNGKEVWLYGEAYNLMYYTGVRTCELLGLKWEDVNNSDNTLAIQRSVVRVISRNNDLTPKNTTEVLVQNSLKSDNSYRKVFLNNGAKIALEKLYSKSKSDEYIVSNKRGEVVDPHQLRRTFYRILDKTGIERGGLHSLRHTFASHLFRKGCDVKTVSKLLGHASVKITYETYIHLLEDNKIEAVKLLDIS